MHKVRKSESSGMQLSIVFNKDSTWVINNITLMRVIKMSRNESIFKGPLPKSMVTNTKLNKTGDSQ